MTEETLGRRIAVHRKQLGLTQDALAEQLGVTAQAVSKWENNQSCPDISMLPRLAEIFGITIDALLGVEKKTEREALPPAAPEIISHPAAAPSQPGMGIGIALWLLLAGLTLLVVEVRPWYRLAASVSVWETLCLTGLMVYGLFGLYPRFSLFRLGCGLVGGYYLYVSLFEPPVQLNEELLLPVLLLFFGAGLLVDSIRGKGKLMAHLSVNAGGKNAFEYQGSRFLCSTVFGEDHRNISLQELEGGEASVCFGELTVNVCDCGSYQADCSIALKCAFGSLELLVPRTVCLECTNRNFFGAVQERGNRNPSAQSVIRVTNEVCFGEISIKYI